MTDSVGLTHRRNPDDCALLGLANPINGRWLEAWNKL